MDALRSPHALIVIASLRTGSRALFLLPDEALLARPMAAFLLPTAAAICPACCGSSARAIRSEGANAGETLATYDA